MIPGSHKGELLHHDYPDWEDTGGANKAFHGVMGVDGARRIHLEMDAGDTVRHECARLCLRVKACAHTSNHARVGILPSAADSWLGGQSVRASPLGRWMSSFSTLARSTDGYRKAISCHYASSRCHYIDVRGTLQEGIAKEVEDLAKRRFGVETDFRTVWRVKSRVVAGEEFEDGL